MTPAGTILDPDAIVVSTDTVEAEDLHRLDLAAGDDRSVVVWSIYHYGEGGPWAQSIKSAQIECDGTVSTHPAHEFTRAVLVAYDRFVLEAPYASSRALARLLSR